MQSGVRHSFMSLSAFGSAKDSERPERTSNVSACMRSVLTSSMVTSTAYRSSRYGGEYVSGATRRKRGSDPQVR